LICIGLFSLMEWEFADKEAYVPTEAAQDCISDAEEAFTFGSTCYVEFKELCPAPLIPFYSGCGEDDGSWTSDKPEQGFYHDYSDCEFDKVCNYLVLPRFAGYIREAGQHLDFPDVFHSSVYPPPQQS